MSALLVRTSSAPAPPMVVTVTGEIDIATAPALRRHLLSLPDCSTILDLSGVSLLCAAGLTELVDLHTRLTRVDARLALAAAPPPVRRVLVITGLDNTLTLTDTLDDAVTLVTTPIRRRSPASRRPGDRGACTPVGRCRR